jgi:hypothetical protein
VQYSRLTDDDLRRAITKNTNAMSTLFDQQRAAGTSTLLQTRATIAINNLEREYQNCAAELRRRDSTILNSETPSSVRSDRAA